MRTPLLTRGLRVSISLPGRRFLPYPWYPIAMSLPFPFPCPRCHCQFMPDARCHMPHAKCPAHLHAFVWCQVPKRPKQRKASGIGVSTGCTPGPAKRQHVDVSTATRNFRIYLRDKNCCAQIINFINIDLSINYFIGFHIDPLSCAN